MLKRSYLYQFIGSNLHSRSVFALHTLSFKAMVKIHFIRE